MNENQKKVISYLKENWIIGGLYELENNMECVPENVAFAFEKLTLRELYEVIEETVKQLKEELQ